MTTEDSEQRLFDTLRREPFENVFLIALGAGNDEYRKAVVRFYGDRPWNCIERVIQYGWTPEEFIEYAREHYGKDSVTK